MVAAYPRLDKGTRMNGGPLTAQVRLEQEVFHRTIREVIRIKSLTSLQFSLLGFPELRGFPKQPPCCKRGPAEVEQHNKVERKASIAD